MGISSPTPIQAGAIPALLQGHDVVGQARTGSGKTLAFALPMIERCDPKLRAVQALVLVPTRELAIQVAGVISQVSTSAHLRTILLYGGRSAVPEQQALASGPQIVVGTPGRTLDHLREGKLNLKQVRLLVLDEGDEMLDRGFAPDVERIIGYTPRERQTALFSATMPEWVAKTAARHLRTPVTVEVDAEQSSPPEIEHTVYEMELGDKLGALQTLLDLRDDRPIIVFGRTKHGVKKLARQLEEMGYPAAALQGNLSQNARERVMADFRSGQTPILLATNVAARGLDVQGVGQVINYELPESPELFTHRVGRTGRMGEKGEAITFITPDDHTKLREIERKLGHRLPRRLLPRMTRSATPARPVAVAVAMAARPTTPSASSAPRTAVQPKPATPRPTTAPKPRSTEKVAPAARPAPSPVKATVTKAPADSGKPNATQPPSPGGTRRRRRGSRNASSSARPSNPATPAPRPPARSDAAAPVGSQPSRGQQSPERSRSGATR